jgi:hypothetical protein
MSGDAHPPEAPKGDAGKSKGPNYFMILIIVVVIMLNVLGTATGQIGNFLQMLKMNGGPLLAIGAIIFLQKAMK